MSFNIFQEAKKSLEEKNKTFPKEVSMQEESVFPSEAYMKTVGFPTLPTLPSMEQSQYQEEFVPGKKESMEEKLSRDIARSRARAFETAIGLPGSMFETLTDISDYLTKKLGVTPSRELIQQELEKRG